MIKQLLTQTNIEIPSNIPSSALAWIIAARIRKNILSPLILVLENNQTAEQITQEIIQQSSPEGILYFPDWETIAYDRYQPHPHATAQRLSALHKAATNKIKCIITSANTLLYKTVTPKWICNNVWSSNNTKDRASWLKQLHDLYERTSQLEREGQYAIRGNIIDIYPINQYPVRIEFTDDMIEQITMLDKYDFTPIKKISSIELTPKFECNGTNKTNWQDRLSYQDKAIIKRLESAAIVPGYQYYLPAYHEELTDLRSYLPNAQIIVQERAQAALLTHWEILQKRYKLHTGPAIFHPSDIAVPPETFLTASSKKNCITKYQPLDIAQLLEEKTVICSKNSARQMLLLEHFNNQNIPVKKITLYDEKIDKGLNIAVLKLTESFSVPQWQLHYIAEEDLYQNTKTNEERIKKTVNALAATTQWDSFNINQKVSHREYGIALFEGIEHLEEHGITAFVKLRYAQNKIVYIPIDNLENISPYYGEADLDEIGSSRWQRRVKSAKESCEKYAAELLKLDATRQKILSTAININEHYKVFCEQFYFEQTDDQKRVTEEILADLKKSKPMDRLLIGDVGFGKTEVLLRAAFCCIMDGKQVIMLCPTTILAEQHYQTAKERMSNWPISLSLLSRSKSSLERKRLLMDFETGKIDFLIATHAILAKMLKTEKLALIIVDEEHRFGVKDKQKLLELNPHAHKLSVTATPIPRTLQSALQNLKAMSFIQHPPKLRLSVKTIVKEYNQAIVEEAILRETMRGGQVFFIHNDIDSHETIKQDLAKSFPDLMITNIHGRMSEQKTTEIMHDFLAGKYQILISSTIIESGIDIPNANTIIINRADLLGLAQLHQLRGRVGRSNHQSYAYLFYPEGLSNKDAQKRLEALENHSTLGSGWLLAIKDLEIRGAGSILGEEQSGHLDHIGYGLYQKLLDEALNGDTGLVNSITIDLKTEHYIPEQYINDISTRITLYRNLNQLQTIEQLEDYEAYLHINYGPPPIPTMALIAHQNLIIQARKLDICSIAKQQKRIIINLNNHNKINNDLLFKWANEKRFDLKFTSNNSFSVLSENDSYNECLSILKLLAVENL